MTARRYWFIAISFFLCLVLHGNTVLADEGFLIFPLQITDHNDRGGVLPARDPFNWPALQQAALLRNAARPQQAFEKLTLQAIFWDDVPQAVINQASVFEGDKIGDIAVFRIEKDKVTVELDHFHHVLQFAEHEVDFGHKRKDPEVLQ